MLVGGVVVAGGGVVVVQRVGGGKPETRYVTRHGDDAASGTAGHPWRTTARVNAAALVPGSTVRFARGETFRGPTLVVSSSGRRGRPITIGAFGSGARPVLDGGGTAAPTAGTHEPIRVRGNWVVIEGLRCQFSAMCGISVYGTDCVVRDCTLTHNAIGVQQQASASRLTVSGCRLVENTLEVVGPGRNDDYGCIAVGLGGDSAEVSGNYSSGNVGLSPDYGTDGSFCEVFNATNANVHHNTSVDDLAFSECGNSTVTADNTFHHNLMWSAVPRSGGLNVHGGGDFGGVTGTRWINNTVVLTDPASVGYYVTGPTTCTVHNNIFVSAYCGNSVSAIDEAGNVYRSTKRNGVRSSHSRDGSSMASSSVQVADAGLVRAALHGDFHLRSSSPAIDRGVATPYRVDFDGRGMHGRAWDAGAYEYEG